MPNETTPPRPPAETAPNRDAAADRAGLRGGRKRRPRRGGAGSGGEPDGPARRPGRDGEPTAPLPAEDLVVVQFKGRRKAYFHNRQAVDVAVGSYCLVEADRGRDLGRVTYVGKGPAAWWSQAGRQGVLALATPRDLETQLANRAEEDAFRAIAREKILARDLDMTLVGVERQFDRRKVTFYFTAEKRVDFRQLVRDLAAVFRTRIELRQIGVRDEARHKGGLGICGREFCCSGFLHEFVPVTLKMAKVQQLPLNPGKLSGPCGRLRCCMTYEHEVYQELRRSLPRVGASVRSPQGTAVVRKLDLLRESVSVSIEGVDGLVTFPAEALAWDGGDDMAAPRPRGGERSGGCGGCGGGGRNHP